ncbi:FxsA family protein [Bacillus sp. FJAT-42376]|uniref:FxsA family protein n=1 Tax=Bacillus sp. FJAT-42376 TaxID=2014076 RepID=UPI001F15259B|nr:FxsA family protein [Bacillus sp. FJAT-42376]
MVLLLIAVTAIEMVFLIWSERTFGLFATICFILATGIAGVWLARRQGLETWKKARLNMNAGFIPGEELVDGICILLGAILLMAPGFLSDAAGFLLLFPAARKRLRPFIYRAVQKRMNRNRITIIR